ncbi:MAG: hypothetical protein IT364_12565 [Candidatus Hydrogenedentes bacterium]|nr:hypothetical protein [Candidatus Hydrogenedentota bacterium]
MKNMDWLAVVGFVVLPLAAIAEDPVPGPFKSEPTLVQPEEDGICLRYNASKRRSSRDISIGLEGKIPVDIGILGHGVEAYLSLAGPYVIVVDATTKKTLWATYVGRWYESLSFVRARDSKTGNDVVLLRAGGKGGDGRFFEIMTGSERYLTKDEQGLMASDQHKQELRGRPLDIGQQFSGDDSKIEKQQCVRVTSGNEWEKLWSNHTGGKDAVPEIDFTTHMAVGVFNGRGSNCEGITLLHALDCEDAIELFVQGRYYQTGPAFNRVTAYGIYFLPMSAKKVIVKYNCQGLIGGPPIWKTIAEFKPLDGDTQPDAPAEADNPLR